MFTAFTSDEFWLIFIRLGESLIFLTADVAWGYRRNSKPRTCAQRNISLWENMLSLIQNVDNSGSLRSTPAFMFMAYTSDVF